MKINTKQELKSLDGKPVLMNNEVLVVGHALANILTYPRQKSEMDKMKLYILAQKFYSEAEVEIDDADLENIKRTIETDAFYSATITGQLLQILSKK